MEFRSCSHGNQAIRKSSAFRESGSLFVINYFKPLCVVRSNFCSTFELLFRPQKKSSFLTFTNGLSVCFQAQVLDWALVAEKLDHDGFFMPDSRALEILVTLFRLVTPVRDRSAGPKRSVSSATKT